MKTTQRSLFCFRCGGIFLPGFPNINEREIMIAGESYHLRCSKLQIEEKIEEDIKLLDRLLAERRELNKLKGGDHYLG